MAHGSWLWDDRRAELIGRSASPSSPTRSRTSRSGEPYLDGEAVVEDARGVAGFSLLQAALGALDGPGHKAALEAVLYGFDLLHLDGQDLRSVLLVQRKARRPICCRLCQRPLGCATREHMLENGEAMFRLAAAMGLEGIVSNRRAVALSGAFVAMASRE
jgi:ATP-dependent DNA ligase